MDEKNKQEQIAALKMELDASSFDSIKSVECRQDNVLIFQVDASYPKEENPLRHAARIIELYKADSLSPDSFWKSTSYITDIRLDSAQLTYDEHNDLFSSNNSENKCMIFLRNSRKNDSYFRKWSTEFLLLLEESLEKRSDEHSMALLAQIRNVQSELLTSANT